MTTSQRTSSNTSTSRVPEDARTVDDSLDDAAQLRQLVLPRLVPGPLYFGIPPAPEGEPNPALAACAFSAHSPRSCLYPAGETSQLQIPRAQSDLALNDTLMTSRAFRDPSMRDPGRGRRCRRAGYRVP